ncbi:hypothetical protein ACLOJK_036979 [Asimina triloba]
MFTVDRNAVSDQGRCSRPTGILFSTTGMLEVFRILKAFPRLRSIMNDIDDGSHGFHGLSPELWHPNLVRDGEDNNEERATANLQCESTMVASFINVEEDTE